jgi:hypothetical protein
MTNGRLEDENRKSKPQKGSRFFLLGKEVNKKEVKILIFFSKKKDFEKTFVLYRVIKIPDNTNLVLEQIINKII